MNQNNKSQIWFKCVSEYHKYPTNKEIDRYLDGEISFEEIRDWIDEISQDAKTQEEYTKIYNDRI